ncbi:MAG: hypothetical protein Q9159_006352 [Coniocarpon cinnabarinum]
MEWWTAALVTLVVDAYAYFRHSLTFRGIVAATLTAAAHAVHPWSIWFALLFAFFFSGTAVTKIKQAHKSTLTTSSEPSPPPVPGQKPKAHPRGAVQVFCNSLPASILIIVHAVYLTYPDYLYGLLASTPGQTATYEPPTCLMSPTSEHFPRSRGMAISRSGVEKLLNLFPYGIAALYATAAADTFASELGIMSQEEPILLTDLLRFKITAVPKGTNGGVTLLGIAASGLGACVVTGVYVSLIPLCAGQWDAGEQITLALGTIAVGTVGALLDSVLGAWFQASVVDVPSGKIVENAQGGKVVFRTADGSYQVAGKQVGRVEEKRKLVMGRDMLSNNGVNIVTGICMAVGTMAVAFVLAR